MIPEKCYECSEKLELKIFNHSGRTWTRWSCSNPISHASYSEDGIKYINPTNPLTKEEFRFINPYIKD